MKLNRKQVLVTGATGFIGGRLVEKLVIEQRANVRVLVRDFSHASRIARFDLEMARGDITDGSAVAEAAIGCEIIFHCAYGFRGSRQNRQRVAVDGTENIAKAALKTGARLVHVSTVDVYGWPLQEALDESSAKSPGADIYAQTKFAAEELLWSYHRQHALRLVVVQPTVVYGPFSRPWTLSVVEQIKNRRLVLVDGGDGVCNPVYIDDVVDALVLAGTEPRAVGETFLISGPRAITWREFYAAFEELLGENNTASISFGEPAQTSSRLSPFQCRVIDTAMESRILRKVYEKSRGLLPHDVNGLIHSTVLKLLAKKAQTVGPLDESKLRLYRTRCQVKIDKARRLLGYEPLFSFERGMALTGQFLRWADLIPSRQEVQSTGCGRAASRWMVAKQINDTGAEFLSV